MSIKESFEKIKLNDFLVEIYGLGYVGFPLAVRLSSNEVKVIGIDVDNERIERLKKEQLMDSELLLKKEFLESRKKGMLKLENKPSIHSKPKIGIVCVPTPIPTETTSSDIFKHLWKVPAGTVTVSTLTTFLSVFILIALSLLEDIHFDPRWIGFGTKSCGGLKVKTPPANL